MKDIENVLVDFDRAYSGSYERNLVVTEDIDFAKNRGGQWRGSDLEQYKNKPKPEFNKVARAVNRILGQFMRMEMNAKIITASDDATDEDAEVLQGRWRNDFNNSDGNEAVHIAADEAFHGGFGAFKLVTKYDDEETASADYQHIELEPIMGAASSVVFGAGAIRKDKKDAKQAWQLMRVNRFDAEEEYGDFASFPAPVTDLSFDWSLNDTNKDIYIAHYYEVVHKTIHEYKFAELTITQDKQTYTDQDGNKLEREVAREWIDNVDHEKVTRKVKCVEYALMSGNRFLTKPRRLPFKSIPIIPMYGYHWTINGIEHYCGEVSRQKDPQRFENMLMASLMEIAAAPQTEKDIYTPEQIAGHEEMHANMNTEDYAYLLVNPIEDAQGNMMPVGPVGKYTPPQVGTGLQAGLMKLGEMQNIIAGTGQTTLPANASGAAVQQINDRQDDSYQPMIQNAMQSLRSACEAWIPAAKEIYFSVQRTLRVMAIDGSFSRVETMQVDTDANGQIGYNKNTARGQYDVIVKMGESYKTRKEAERQTALEMAQFAGSDTEMGQLFLMDAALNTTGDGSAKLRKIVSYRQVDLMIQMQIPPQEIMDMVSGDEMKQYAEQKIMQMQQAAQMQGQQMQQQQQAMFQAQLQGLMSEASARENEGTAAVLNEINDARNIAVKEQDAETKRIDVLGRLQQAGVKLDMEMMAQIAEAYDKVTQGNREQQLANLDYRRAM